MESDEALFKNYQSSGDQNILAKLYGRYTEMVYLTAMKYLKDQDESKDVTGDIYLKLAANPKLPEIKSFKNWLFIVTRNHCLRIIRNHGTHPTVEFIPENFVHIPDDSDHSFKWEQEDKLKRVHACIEKLKGDQKNAVILFHLEEKCYKEVERLLGLDEGGARSLIQNGRRNLKICMEAV